MKKVFLDSNALLAVGQFKIDILAELDRICLFEYEVCVLSGSIDELEKIVNEQKGKDKQAAKLGLSFVKKLNIIKSSGNVDDVLVEKDKEGNYIVTQDRELKNRIKNLIIIRQKKYLELK